MDILKFLRKISAVGMAAAVLAGCTKEFEPDLSEPPVLCLNSLMAVGEPFEATLTRTWRYSDGYVYEIADLKVSDGTVALEVNGRHVADMICDDASGTYRCDYRPAPGDIVTVAASSPSYGDAKATITIPRVTTIELASCTPRFGIDTYTDLDGNTVATNITGSIDITLRIRDAAGTDYYQAAWSDAMADGTPDYTGEEIVYFTVGTPDFDAEPLFSEHISALEAVFGSDAYGFTVFTDRSFDGRERTVRLLFENARVNFPDVATPDAVAPGTCRFTVSLRNISESLYNWYLRDWQDTDGIVGTLAGIGFAETICGYSNVSSRAGIVSATATSSIEIDITDYIQNLLKQSQQ